MNNYRNFLKEKGKSENTIATYISHIKKYKQWYRETFGAELSMLFRLNVLDYISYLKNIEKLKAESINSKLSAIASYN